MNFFLAYIGALLMPLPSGPFRLAIDPLDVAELALAQHPIIAPFLFYFMLTNLVLGLFNLLPIPPLDGGRIAVGLLPLPLARLWAQLERAGIVLVVLLVFLLPPACASSASSSTRSATRWTPCCPGRSACCSTLSGHAIGGVTAVVQHV